MTSDRYDVLIVGAGLFGSTIARLALDEGKRVLVLEKRGQVGGNCWSHRVEGVEVHAYGPHVVHTNDPSIWGYFERFAELSPCIISPLARYHNEAFNLPFNMNTFHQLWGVITPREAMEEIERQRVPCEHPRNLEEHVLDMVGYDVYEKLVKGYTEKQYGKPCSELPASLISRMPLLFTYENDYLHTRYQGVPSDGYEPMFRRMLDGADVELGINYLDDRERLSALAQTVIYTGPIDEYYGYCFGPLEWRGRRFVDEVLDEENYQGASLVNYTSTDVDWLRITEHRHFIKTSSDKTVITREYATEWNPGDEPFYSVNDEANQERYGKYRELSAQEPNVRFGGRLGEYRYYTMAATVASAFKKYHEWF